MTSHVLLNRLSLTSIRRHRRTIQRITYYKTECLDCEVVISVRWEKEYLSALSTPPRLKIKHQTCPFCDGNHLEIVPINENEYRNITS